MRIQGPNAAVTVAAPSTTRRTAAGDFSVSEEGAARPAAAPVTVRTVGGIDALIALQGIGDPTERRRHAVKRGRLALDALDELKVGLLGSELSPATVNRLKAAAAHLRDRSGDAGLDGVLDEIELRVEVEIAKLAAR